MCGCTSSFGPDRYGPDYGARFAFLGKGPAAMPWLAGSVLDPNAPDPNCPTCRLGGTGRPAVMNNGQAQFAQQVVGPAGQVPVPMGPAPTGHPVNYVPFQVTKFGYIAQCDYAMPTNFSPAAFLGAVGSSCAQWSTLSIGWKNSTMTGYAVTRLGSGGTLRTNSPTRFPLQVDNQSPIPVAAAHDACWVSTMVSFVDRYCAMQGARTTAPPLNAAGQATERVSMPYGQEAFGGQSVAPAGQVALGLTPGQDLSDTNLFPPGASAVPSGGWWPVLPHTNFNSAAFFAAINSSCAQWQAINHAFKRSVMRGYVVGAIAAQTLAIINTAGGAQAINPGWPNSLAWLDNLIAMVDQYCAIQHQQQNIGAVAPRGGLPGATLLPKLYPHG